jgi:superfamily I DNA/RNA helicase
LPLNQLPLIGPLARSLPGHYEFTPAKDIADGIEQAKVRRIPPERCEQQAPADRAPIPPDLFARLYAGYERAKERAHRVDFEDMLALTVELLKSDAEAAPTGRVNVVGNAQAPRSGPRRGTLPCASVRKDAWSGYLRWAAVASPGMLR